MSNIPLTYKVIFGFFIAAYFLLKGVIVRAILNKYAKAKDDLAILPKEKDYESLQAKLKADEEEFLKADKAYEDSKKPTDN